MRRFLAFVLYVCIGLPLAFSALLLISVRPWALDRETYKRFVEDDRLYAALQSPQIARRAPDRIMIGGAALEGPAAVTAAQKDLPFPEIKATATRAIDTVLDAVEGESSGRSLSIDLKPLKTALQAKSPAMARDYVAALAEAGSAQGALAQPAVVQKALSAAVGTIPDALSAPAAAPSSLGRMGFPLGRLSQGPPPFAMGLGARGLSQALLNRMTATTAAVAALLLAGLGALGGSGALSRLSRAGRYLLLPSIVILAAGVALAIPSGLVLQNVFPQNLRGMVDGAASAQFRAYLANALGPIARSFFITGLVGCSLGGVLAQARRLSEPKELE